MVFTAVTHVKESGVTSLAVDNVSLSLSFPLASLLSSLECSLEGVSREGVSREGVSLVDGSRVEGVSW